MACCFSAKSKKQNIPFLEKYDPIFEKVYSLDDLSNNKEFIQEGNVVIDDVGYHSELYTDYLIIKHKTKKVFRILNLQQNNKLKQTNNNKFFYKEIFDRDFKNQERVTTGIVLLKGLNTLKNEGNETKKMATKQMSKLQKQMSKMMDNEPKFNKITLKISLVQYLQQVVKQFKTNLYQYNFYEMYKTVEILGKGASGTVFNIVNRESKNQYAGKIINKQKLLQEEGVSLEAIEYEILLMKQISSKYVLQIVEVFEDVKYYYLILEIFFGGSLDNQLLKKQYFSISEVHTIMNGLLLAVKDLHEVGIMHRDIKPSNILLQDDDYSNIVLCDLGLATQVEVQPYLFQNVGTPGYVAPEVFFEEGKYSEICDMFSCGIVFYEILFNKMPWKSTDMEEVIEENKLGEINLDETKRLMFGQGLYKEFELLEKLLCVDPKKRINVKDALEYPFFKQKQQEQKIEKELKEVLDQDYVENQQENNEEDDLPKEIQEELKEIDKKSESQTTQAMAGQAYAGQSQFKLGQQSNFNLLKGGGNNGKTSTYSLNQKSSQSKFNLNKNLKHNNQRKTQINIISEQNAVNKAKMSILATPQQRQSIHQKYQIHMPKNSISYKRPTVMGQQILQEFDNKKINAIMEEEDYMQQQQDNIQNLIMQHQKNLQNQGNNSIIESEDDTDSDSTVSKDDESMQTQEKKQQQQEQQDNKETMGVTDEDEKPPNENTNKIETVHNCNINNNKRVISQDILTDDEQLSKRNNIRKFSPVLKNRVKNDPYE